MATNEEMGGIELKDIPAETIKECLMEAIHGDWDGWPEEEKKTLNYLMYDIMRYHRHSR